MELFVDADPHGGIAFSAASSSVFSATSFGRDAFAFFSGCAFFERSSSACTSSRAAEARHDPQDAREDGVVFERHGHIEVDS